MTTEQIKPTIYNGSITIQNTKTGEHRTFQIRTAGEKSKLAGKRLVSLLVGPENTRDYQGFAFVDENGIRVWRTKVGAPGKPSAFDVYANMIWSLAKFGENSPWHQRGYTMACERKCMRCNRKLTHPESIESGIGPECAGRS